MKTVQRTDTLESLLDWLDTLDSRAPMDELTARLDGMRIDPDEIAEYLQFDEHRYRRNLIREGRHYHALALCWRSGQRSPIHDHAQSVCGLRVLKGIATETVFETSPSALLKAVRSVDHEPGEVIVTHDADIHQISNLQVDGVDLVTLHIYSPPLLAMKCYSIIDRYVGEYRPMVDEFVHGAGI